MTAKLTLFQKESISSARALPKRCELDLLANFSRMLAQYGPCPDHGWNAAEMKIQPAALYLVELHLLILRFSRWAKPHLGLMYLRNSNTTAPFGLIIWKGKKSSSSGSRLMAQEVCRALFSSSLTAPVRCTHGPRRSAVPNGTSTRYPALRANKNK
jgi:hypothetical protein